MAYRRVIDEWRAQDLRLDLAFTLLERSLLLGGQDKSAAAGRAEAAELFAAMGADGLIERLESGAPRQMTVKPSPEPQVEGAAATTR